MHLKYISARSVISECIDELSDETHVKKYLVEQVGNHEIWIVQLEHNSTLFYHKDEALLYIYVHITYCEYQIFLQFQTLPFYSKLACYTGGQLKLYWHETGNQLTDVMEYYTSYK